ncbi:hypothetical protein QYS48_11295 [Marivirga arenosa]|uniref:MORN repeat protein n=1 Tax=Marivirga arenosa TaxID=3059076 RepID=A0AA49JI83_9BACT|nr:hypothetical protein [Marivirga sp. ABR2-2]WKK87306.1 hypothetical protein QYS48_11295 [Marivirga sp. ABR2-2]
MQYKKVNISLTLAAIIAAGIAVFFYMNNISLEMKLAESNERINKTDSLSIYFTIGEIDSLLFNERYEEALQAYKAFTLTPDKQDLSPFISARIKLAKHILSLRKELKAKDSFNIGNNDTIITERLADPEEIRQYDSLQFALTKIMLQNENLKKQLKQKESGEYLVFELNKGNKVYYVGAVKNDQANGKGVAIFDSGSRYEGEWENNQRHGEGSFYWPDGEYYIGEFKNDKRSGKGTYYWPNGEKFTGEWAENKRNGKGIFYSKEGEIVAQGIWKDDDLIDVQKK